MQSCLQDDPTHRWTAAHISAALSSIPHGPAPPMSVSSLQTEATRYTGRRPVSFGAAPAAPPPEPAQTPHGGVSVFSGIAPSTPQSMHFREMSLDFARVRVPRPQPMEIFGIAAPAQLPPTLHVRPASPSHQGHSADKMSWRCKAVLTIAPAILMIAVPVLIARLVTT